MAKSKKKVPMLKGTPKDVRAGGNGLPPKSGMKNANKFGKGKGC